MTPEIHRQLNVLCASPDWASVTMKTKDVQTLLLETGGNTLACGRLYDFVVKDIGAGVSKVSLTLTHP